jgi:RNA polymerase sigma-70 factor (ECF subfamily)
MEKDHKELFLKILELNKERLFRICRSYSIDADEAKDLFQEILLNIWKSLPTFKSQSDINTWVYRIALNICLRAREFTEKKEKHFIKLEGIHFENIEEPVSESKDKELQFLNLFACIQKLPEDEKSLILLYLEELPYKEIAKIFGITENLVSVKIKRIKTKLLTLLNSDNDGG